MKVLYQKKFLKDLAAIPITYRTRVENFAFEQLIQYENFAEINAEKMAGYKNFYKVRFGDYRLGLRFEKGTITLERILHRKEIYRYFP